MRTQATGARSLFLFSSCFSFRKREAKERPPRNGCLSVLLPLSPTRSTKRTVRMRTVRFFVPSRTCGKASFLRLIIYPAMSFVSFLQEKKSSPSFLFRRKKRSACTGSAGPQTDGRRHILRCRRSEYHSGYASLLRLVFARVRRACASAFPCKPTTQKKINCGAAFLLCSCRFRQRAAQNGRFKCEPSVSSFHTGRAGKRLFAD